MGISPWREKMAQFYSPPSWNQIQEQLKLAMQKEVNLMREILANMHQEELSLLMNDTPSWQKVMDERSEMVLRMSYLRKQRDLVALQFKENAKHKSKKLFEILKAGDEISSEILSLLDQILALTERTNLQNCRNDFLFHQEQMPQNTPLHCHYPPPFLKPIPARAARKTQLATYPRKKSA